MPKFEIPAVSKPTTIKVEGRELMVFPNPADHTKAGIALGARKISAVLAFVPEAKAFVAASKPAPAPAKKSEASASEQLEALKAQNQQMLAVLQTLGIKVPATS